MFEKKCPNCKKKVKRSFLFCPWCGNELKKINEEDYGLLGIDDNISKINKPDEFSFIERILDNTLKKIFTEFSKNMINKEDIIPRKIDVIFSSPEINYYKEQIKKNKQKEIIEKKKEEEFSKRNFLPKVEPLSTIKRLPEGLLYEIDAPGVNSKKDVLIKKLEEGFEVQAFSPKKCYVKTIPINSKNIQLIVKNEKIYIRIKENY